MAHFVEIAGYYVNPENVTFVEGGAESLRNLATGANRALIHFAGGGHHLELAVDVQDVLDALHSTPKP